MTIAKMLTGVLMTVAGRIATALGLSVVTYVGLDGVQGYFLNQVSSVLGNIPHDVLQIMYIAGFGVMLNWTFGTFAFVVSLHTMQKLAAVVGQK